LSFKCGPLGCTGSLNIDVEEGNCYLLITVPGDGGSQVEAKLNKDKVVHYLCEKTTQDFFNIWLNMELLVPWVIDCWVS
jgi:lysophospholipase-3